MSPRVLGIAAALLGILIDQAHKAYMLGPYAIDMKGRVAVTPFLDLVLVWNTGVSYGLFAQHSELGRWLLVALGLGGSILFAWWLLRARRALQGLAFGLIVAGALSNALDRIVHGAVADFFLFHIGSFEWYVFNLADVWIVAGIVGLLIVWAGERRQLAAQT
jgi:signal peptidase II